jgi:hypothetical protein
MTTACFQHSKRELFAHYLMGGERKKSTILETRKLFMTTLGLTGAAISAKNPAIQQDYQQSKEESFWPHINPRKREAGRTRRDA